MQKNAMILWQIAALILILFTASCGNPQIVTTQTSGPVSWEESSVIPTGNPPKATDKELPQRQKSTETNTPKLTSTPNFDKTATQVYWLGNTNMAFSISGKGFFLGRSDSEEGVKISSEEVRQFEWSQDGSWLAYAVGDMTTVLDMNTGLQTNIKAGTSMAWHPSSQFLVVGGSGKLSLIDVTEGKVIDQTTFSDSTGLTTYLSFSPDGSQLAYLESIYLYIIDLVMDENDLPTQFGESVYLSDKVENQIWRVSWSPAGDRLALLIAPFPGDPFVGFFTVDGILRSQIKIPDFIVNEFVWSPDGRYLALLGFGSLSRENRILVFDYQSKALTTVDRGGSLGGLNWLDDNNKVVYLRLHDFGIQSEFLLSDIAGIQKQILPASMMLTGEWATGFVNFRPGKVISAVSTPTPTPDPLCTQWTRLKVDEYVRMVDTVSNRVRSLPQKGDNIIGMINPGTVVKVLEGPVCADGLVFWRVAVDSIPGGSGWTAEGDGQNYWLEPVEP